MNECVSVIIPAYNAAKYLENCLDSVLSQTYPNIEIIVVDDGSTDDTLVIAERYQKHYTDRLKTIHKKNSGVTETRFEGILASRGEWIGFVDADDEIEQDMYERLYRGIAEYNVTVAQIGRDEIDAEGNLLPNICEPPAEPICFEAEDFLRELLMHRGDCSFCTKLLHRDLLGTERFPEGLLNEDFYLLVKILPQIGRLVSLPGQTYHVFYRIGSNSRKADKEAFSRVFGDCVDNADMAADIVEKDYPQLKETALRFGVFQRLEYLLHIPVSHMTKDNGQYRAVVKWMRQNLWKSMKNTLLTKKNKCYHILFAVAPRGIRMLHKKIKGL